MLRHHSRAVSDSVDLYAAVGGREGCRKLSEAFYARVDRDPVLRPLFPGKSMRCAIEAFAAFLAQFLGGPGDDAEKRWSLSLRESHLRFRIGPKERDAWMRNMASALAESPIEENVRRALGELFARSSAYLVNSGEAAPEPAGSGGAAQDSVHTEMAKRWAEQRALDEVVSAIGGGSAEQILALLHGPELQARFARDRAVLAHVLGLLMRRGEGALSEYVERAVRADAAVGKACGRHGRTLLHEAAAQGNLRMVELLLQTGADANGRPSKGHTPLYCVANECQTPGGGDVVRALVAAGAEVDSRSEAKRCTPLHMAARRGNVEVAGALLDCGADIEARDIGGDTPLRRARNCRKAAVAALLLSRGADDGQRAGK